MPDDLLVALVRERIAEPDCDRGFVLDGFPRTLPQAQGLEEMTAGDPRAWVVFDFEVPRAVLMLRLSGRRWCPRCQATFHLENDPPKRDGRLRRVRHRRSCSARTTTSRWWRSGCRQYDERTFPLIEYYRDAGADDPGRRQPADGRGVPASCCRRWRCRRERPEVLERAPDDGPRLPDRGRRPRRARGGGGARGDHQGDGPDRRASTSRRRGRGPAFLGYRGYPATLCISVNEEVVHGIPGPRKLREGDIVGLDLGCIVDGLLRRRGAHGRGGAGRARRRQRLMKVTRESLFAGHRRLPARQAGGRHRARGADPRREHGYSVVREFVGHGIGTQPPRGAAGAELRAARAARAAGAGDVPGHRADGQRGAGRRSRSSPTAGRR